MSEYKSPSMNQFLRDPEKELGSHNSISEKNCGATQQLQNYISSLPASLDSSESQMFDKFLQLKKENVYKKIADDEQKAQEIAMTAAVERKRKGIVSLEKKLKVLTEEYEKLKIAKKEEKRESCVSCKIFEKALKYYTTYFQYTIEEGTVDEDDKFCAIITFIFEGKQSNYPIRFVFDKQICSLIRFDAGDILNEKQHDILYQRFKESENYIALFSTLRHAAIRKYQS